MKLTKECFASQSFFAPIKLRYPLVLTRQDKMIETYRVGQSAEIEKEIQFEELNMVYDYFWLDDSKFFVLVKDHPIVLRSRDNGKILKKYPVYSHLFEIKSPYCGCAEDRTVFTVLGNVVHQTDLENAIDCPLKVRSKKFRPRTVTTAIQKTGKVLSIASHSKVVFRVDITSGKIVSQISAIPNISQISSMDNLLLIGGQKTSHIQVWDIRSVKSPLHCFDLPRSHPTHQKILFDVNEFFIAVGLSDGQTAIYNHYFEQVIQFHSHFDAVNSVQFSPAGLLSSSGQRHISHPYPLSLIRQFEWMNKSE